MNFLVWLKNFLFDLFMRLLFAAACAAIGVLMAIVILGIKSKVGDK